MSDLTMSSMVEMKKNHVTYGGNKYFRRNAHKIELCSHGRKHDSALSVNYMSVSAKIARRHLEKVPIKVDGPIDVDWTEISQEEFNQWGVLKYFGFNSGLVDSFDQRIARKLSLKLMCFWINENPLTKCLNNEAHNVRNAMAAEGKDARIVSSILVAMDTRLAEHFASQSSKSLTVSGMAADLGISAGSGRVGSKTIQLAEGTTFAYGLHKVKKWGRGKDKIDKLEDDWFSFG